MGQVRLPSRKFICLIVSLLFAVGFGTATDDDLSPQILLDYNPLHRLSPRVDLFGDAGIRWNSADDGWWRLVLRPSVGLRAGQVFLTAGVGNFFTFSPDIAGGKLLTSAPIITSNWEADTGEQWTVPFGGGGGKVFRIGKQPMNINTQVFYNVETPTNGPELQWRFQIQFLFPK